MNYVLHHQRAAAVGAVGKGTAPLTHPPAGAALLTLAIAEHPILLTARRGLCGRTCDGVAEHLLIGRLQHKLVRSNHRWIRTNVCISRSRDKFHSDLRTLTHGWDYADYAQRFRCLGLQMFKQTNTYMSRVISLPTFIVIEITMALTCEKRAADKQVHRTYTANRVKEKQEIWSENGDRKSIEKMQIIGVYTSSPPFPLLQHLTFPLLNHLQTPELFSNLHYFARSLVQASHKLPERNTHHIHQIFMISILMFGILFP